MSNVAGQDDNGYPLLFGVSHLDGITPVKVQFNPSTRGMKVDDSTSIAFSASLNTRDIRLAKATSSSDDSTVLPWVVNASTGAVLISS